MSKQVLHAALDNAATREEWEALLNAAASDAELGQQWSRVWQWRDARDGIAVRSDLDLCSGVMAALAAESQANPSKVVALPARAQATVRKPRTAPMAAQPLPRRSRSFKGWVPVSAVAGAAAAVLVLGGMQWSSQPNAVPVATVATASTPVLGSVPQVGQWQTVAASDNTDTPRAAELLDGYLMEHSNAFSERQMGGNLAGARIAVQAASYTPGR